MHTSIWDTTIILKDSYFLRFRRILVPIAVLVTQFGANIQNLIKRVPRSPSCTPAAFINLFPSQLRIDEATKFLIDSTKHACRFRFNAINHCSTSTFTSCCLLQFLVLPVSLMHRCYNPRATANSSLHKNNKRVMYINICILLYLCCMSILKITHIQHKPPNHGQVDRSIKMLDT